MKNKKKELIPRSVVSKLLNIIVIAIGNILIVAGESLIRYGRENIDALIEDEKSEKSLPMDEDFSDYR